MVCSHLFVGDVKSKSCVDGLMKKYSVYKRASGACNFTTSPVEMALYYCWKIAARITYIEGLSKLDVNFIEIS